MDDLKKFLKLLYKDRKGDVELRALPSANKDPDARFFTRDLKAIVAFCKHYEKEDLYFGVATRKDKKGTKEGCLHIPALWVDVDFKDGQSEATLGTRIAEGPLMPSIMVHSGGGIHLYFLLDGPIESNQILEGILRAMAVYYRGDMKVAEVARILRLPETTNWKYDPPRPVKILEMNDIRYPLEAFEVFGSLLPPGEGKAKSDVDWEKTKAGVAEGARNQSAAQLAGKYYKQGLDFDEVMVLLKMWNENNVPPLPFEELKTVANSIGKTHLANHPPEVTEFKGITVDDFRVVHHDLIHIQDKGLKSGYGQLDWYVGGVWRDGIVLSGKPGDGKTIFGLNLGVGFAEQDHRVIIFDLENDRRDTVKRLALIAFYRKWGSKAPSEQTILEARELKNTWIEVVEKILSPHVVLFGVEEDRKITPAVMDNWLKLASEEMQQTGNQSILIIDSINELATVYPLAKGTYESLERWLAEIKKLRVKYQIPIMLICHVAIEQRAEIFNPKGSSGIAHFARTQIIISSTKPEPGKDQSKVDMEANIVRSQFGHTGKLKFELDRWRLGLRELTKKTDRWEI